MFRSVKVRDYMTTKLVTFKPEDELTGAIERMLKHGISGAPVVNDAGEVVGMISEMDCLKSILSCSYYDYECLGGTVGEYMTREVDVISPEDDILSVTQKYIDQRRRRFPVVENGKLVGQISRRDVLRAIKDFSSAEEIRSMKQQNEERAQH
ncbi:MAG: CBS domain-containing protein [Gammaproteobacteria bacterium]|nr:MAG: CBS domain-containing protein [Gammaproteobacteria bacterium]